MTSHEITPLSAGPWNGGFNLVRESRPAISGVSISEDQRTVHMAFETFALIIGVPFLTYLALNKDLPNWARVISGAMALGTVVVDGGLLLSYMNRKQS